MKRELNDKLCFQGELSFETVDAYQSQFQRLIQQEQADVLRVDLAGVDYSDSAGLALLIEMMRSAKHCEKRLIFCDPPPQMVALAKFCGVDSLLGLDENQKNETTNQATT